MLKVFKHNDRLFRQRSISKNHYHPPGKEGDIDRTVFLTRHDFMMILCTGKLSEEDDRSALYWCCFIFFGLAY
jgi:hypothetical protein